MSSGTGLAEVIPIRLLLIHVLPALLLHQSTPNPVVSPTETERMLESVVSITADVPMRLHRGMPVVAVRVNGSGPFSFGVDTGAMDSVIVFSSLAAQLGARDSDRVPIESISIGDAVFTGISGKSNNLGPAGLPFDGILGLPLFADYLLTLDYPAGCMRIERAELPKADGKTVLALDEHPTGLAILELEVDGESLAALVDTGNTAAAFYLPKSLVSRLTWTSDSGTSRVARTAGGEITLEEIKLAGVVRLGQFDFNQPVVVSGDTFSMAIIGGQAFEEYVVSIDQRNRRMRLSR